MKATRAGGPDRILSGDEVRAFIAEQLIGLDVDGRILKTDALDHHAGHDLVGAQDIAWDVAGAIVEFRLVGDEPRTLVEHVERAAGFPVDTGLLAYLLPCYLTFWLGYYTLALRIAPDVDEAVRLGVAAARYRDGLAAIVAGHSVGATSSLLPA